MIDLTPRQRQVVALLAQGLTYGEVGARLGISAETVRVHVADVAGGLDGYGPPLRRVLAHASRLLGDST